MGFVVGLLGAAVALVIFGLVTSRDYDGHIEGTMGRITGGVVLMALLAVAGLVMIAIGLLDGNPPLSWSGAAVIVTSPFITSFVFKKPSAVKGPKAAEAAYRSGPRARTTKGTGSTMRSAPSDAKRTTVEEPAGDTGYIVDVCTDPDGEVLYGVAVSAGLHGSEGVNVDIDHERLARTFSDSARALAGAAILYKDDIGSAPEPELQSLREHWERLRFVLPVYQAILAESGVDLTDQSKYADTRAATDHLHLAILAGAMLDDKPDASELVKLLDHAQLMRPDVNMSRVRSAYAVAQ